MWEGQTWSFGVYLSFISHVKFGFLKILCRWIFVQELSYQKHSPFLSCKTTEQFPEPLPYPNIAVRLLDTVVAEGIGDCSKTHHKSRVWPFQRWDGIGKDSKVIILFCISVMTGSPQGPNHRIWAQPGSPCPSPTKSYCVRYLKSVAKVDMPRG